MRKHHSVSIFCSTLLLITGFFLFVTVTTQAAIRYVSSQTGSDLGPATDPASPCQTIQYAVDQASNGDKIQIATVDTTNLVTSNTCVYTGSGDNVIELTNSFSLTLEGGYLYAHGTLPISWTKTVVPPVVDAQGARRCIYIAGSDGATSVVELLEFANGSAGDGANVYAEGGNAVFVGTPIHHGTATNKGGGMYLSGIDISMSIGSYSNLALPQLTGMLPVYSNTAKYGAGIYIKSGIPVLSTLGILGNEASSAGGGVYIEGGSPTLAGGALMHNHGSGAGGAFYLSNSFTRIAGMSIVSNDAISGGAFFVAGPFALTAEGATMIANNYICYNLASVGAGGAFYMKEANIGILNNVIAHNAAAEGAAVALYASSPQFYQNTIADNVGQSGIYVTHDPGSGRWIEITTWFGTYSNWVAGIPIPSWPAFTNNIISGHDTGLHVESSGNSLFENKVSMGYTLWTNDTDITGPGTVIQHHDVYADPLYTCKELPPRCANPYHLETNSPAIDTGTVVSLTLPGTDFLVDIDGELRPSGEGMDIGADEVVPLNSYSAWFVPAGYDLTVQPGDIITNEHYLLNSGDQGDQYNITTSNSLAWTSTVTPTTVVMLAQTYTTVVVIITVPGGAADGEENTTMVSATSTTDTDRIAYAVDSCTVQTNANEPTTRYVWLNNPNAMNPYESWATAGREIQTVVDVCNAGDTVMVAEGVYESGGLVPIGRVLTNRVCATNNITIQSENGPENTYIIGQADPATTNGPAAIRCAYLSGDSVLSGFTLINGHTATNAADVTGGGVVIYDSGTVKSCVIRGNNALNYGGGVCLQSGGAAENCLIILNTSAASGGGDGGVSVQGSGAVNNCTISRNYAVGSGGGVGCHSGGDVYNTIMYDNTAGWRNDHFEDGIGMLYDHCCTPRIEATATYDACIINMPDFIDTNASNYRLSYGSPCINSGTNLSPAITNDLDGYVRPLGSEFDIGCYEYNGTAYDSDGDGLMDDDEINTYGTSPINPDTDNDNSNDGDEIFADTDASNSNSVFRLTDIDNSASCIVTFSCTNSRVYSLIYSTNMMDDEWSMVDGAMNVTGYGSSMTLTDTVDSVHRTYRVGVNQP